MDDRGAAQKGFQLAVQRHHEALAEALATGDCRALPDAANAVRLAADQLNQVASEELEILREAAQELKKHNDQDAWTPAPPELMARVGRALLAVDPVAALDQRDALHKRAASGSPWAAFAKATLALLADDPFWTADDEEERRYGGSDD